MRLISGKSFYNKPWYNSYKAMMSRCYRPKDQSYKYYGGRGIRVCDEWHNIEAFEAWEHDNPFLSEQRLTGLTLTLITAHQIAVGQQCLSNAKTDGTVLLSSVTVNATTLLSGQKSRE